MHVDKVAKIFEYLELLIFYYPLYYSNTQNVISQKQSIYFLQIHAIVAMVTNYRHEKACMADDYVHVKCVFRMFRRRLGVFVYTLPAPLSFLT